MAGWLTGKMVVCGIWVDSRTFLGYRVVGEYIHDLFEVQGTKLTCRQNRGIRYKRSGSDRYQFPQQHAAYGPARIRS